jgi:ADP-heptose:LPS heptosyltransferase
MKARAETVRRAILFHNGAIGDFLMFVFLAEQLQKAGYVDRVTLVGPKNLSFLKGLIGSYPYISAIQLSRYGGGSELLKILGQVSLVIMHPALGRVPARLKLLGWCISRARGVEFIGFREKGCSWNAFYSKTLDYNTDRLYIENIQDIVSALGYSVSVQVPALKIIQDSRPVYASGLNRKRYVVFHPGASAPKRAFSISAARQLVQHVLDRHPAMYLVLSGSNTERNRIENIRSGIRGNERIINALGCPARELAAFIHSAQLFIGTDSGVTHLACFLGVPVIVAAHHGTANWLPFYSPNATVLYRLEEEDTVHHSREYLDAHRRGRLKPFGVVPLGAICEVLDKFLDVRRNNASDRTLDDSKSASMPPSPQHI